MICAALAACAAALALATGTTPDASSLDVDALVERMASEWRWRTLPAVPLPDPYALLRGDDGALVAVGARRIATFDGFEWTPAPRPDGLRPLLRPASGMSTMRIAGRDLRLPYDVRRPIEVVRDGGAEPISTPLRFIDVERLDDDLLVGTRDDGLFTAIDAERAPSFEAAPGRTTFRDLCRLDGGRLAALRANAQVLVCDVATDRWLVDDPATAGVSRLVSAIEPSRRGGHWIGTLDGLVHRRRDGTFELPLVDVPLDDGETVTLESVTALHERADGSLWIGSGAAFAGAVEWRDGRSVVHRDPDGLDDFRVHAIRELADGSLWFCLLARIGDPSIDHGGGIARLHGEEWTRWDTDDGLPHGRVYDVVEHAGDLFVATRAGVARYDATASAWRRVTLPGLPDGAHVRELVARADGLWGVHHAPDGGVFRAPLDGGRVTDCATWPVPAAESLAFDDAGVAWITSRRGLWCLRGGGAHPTSHADGIVTALWPIEATLDGRLLLGGSERGLLSFRDDDAGAPRIVGASDRWDTERDELRVVVDARDAWMRTPSNRLRVSWRRPGGSWSPPRDAGDELSLGEVAVGRSVIEMRAVDATGNIGETFVMTVVRPPAWPMRSSTWLLAASAVAVAWSYVRERRAHTAERRAARRALVAAQEDERRAISREIHDDLGQLLNAAMIELSRARRLTGAQHAEALSYARDACRRAGERSRSLSLVLRPRELDELGLRRAVEVRLEELARSASLHTSSSLDDAVDELPDDVAVHVYRIVVEALTNVSRHAAGATRVDLVARATARQLVVEVCDDGEGLPAASPSDAGLGVLGMRERAAILGADLRLESTPDGGTCVRLAVPLHPTG